MSLRCFYFQEVRDFLEDKECLREMWSIVHAALVLEQSPVSLPQV